MDLLPLPSDFTPGQQCFTSRAAGRMCRAGDVWTVILSAWPTLSFPSWDALLVQTLPRRGAHRSSAAGLLPGSVSSGGKWLEQIHVVFAGSV